MLEILIPCGVKAETNKWYGEVSSPCLPTPLLETPFALPQSIKILNREPATTQPSRSSRKDWFGSGQGAIVDKDLTEMLKVHTEGIFTFNVEMVSSNGKNFSVIDVFNNSSQFAIGPRLELLEKYHGIGSELLNLLSRSPAWIMTPEFIDSYLIDMYEHMNCFGDHDKKKRSTGLLPEFATRTRSFTDVPKGLPYTLSKLIEECLANALPNEFVHEFEDDDIGAWPIATCSWYGFQPMLNKHMERFICMQSYDIHYRLECLKNNPDMGQASDPTWMVLDDMIVYGQEKTTSSCIKPCHKATDIECTLFSIGPFAKLLKYLSHARIN